MTLERLRQLGVSDAVLRDRFVYLRPDEAFTSDPAIRGRVLAMLADRQPRLVVVDAFNGALAMHGPRRQLVDWTSSVSTRPSLSRCGRPAPPSFCSTT
jgi:hypothetical protein